MSRVRKIVILALLLGTPLSAQSTPGRFTVMETGRSFVRLQDAVTAIGDGDGTIVIAPGSYRECAVQTQGRIAYTAREAGTVIVDGTSCEGKGGLVLRGRAAHVEGLVFQNFQVPDRNGSGIRLEKGDLSVVNSVFRNSEQGILTNNDPGATVSIDRSTFSGLGGCPDGMCSHSIYVNDNARLIVTRSRFERGTGGHYVKSRAARADISDNSFDDTHGSETNYMIDLPSGATGTIAHNEFVQGRSKENYSAFIAVGAETITNPSAGLTVSANRAAIAPGVQRTSTFVADWTHEAIRLTGNQLGAGLKPYDQR
ncbi:MAG: right-handed parallel beta-helix repeat-containing protein [Chakrabartia godavariana]